MCMTTLINYSQYLLAWAGSYVFSTIYFMCIYDHKKCTDKTELPDIRRKPTEIFTRWPSWLYSYAQLMILVLTFRGTKKGVTEGKRIEPSVCEGEKWIVHVWSDPHSSRTCLTRWSRLKDFQKQNIMPQSKETVVKQSNWHLSMERVTKPANHSESLYPLM